MNRTLYYRGIKLTKNIKAQEYSVTITDIVFSKWSDMKRYLDDISTFYDSPVINTREHIKVDLKAN